jgi:SAM-dependent methyltransferase
VGLHCPGQNEAPPGYNWSVATHRDLVARLLPGLDPAQVDRWLAATAGLAPQAVGRLAAADRFRAVLDGDGDPTAVLRHLGPEAIAACRADGGDPVELARRDVLAGELLALDDGELRAATLADTELAVAALEALRDPAAPLAVRVGAAWPLCTALAAVRGPQVEHEPPPPGVTVRPLLDHVATRCLGRALRGLERGDARLFPPGPSSLVRERDRVALLASAGLLPAVRAALLHLDVAKGGDEGQRRRWAGLGVDLSVHNAAAARLVERTGARTSWPLSSVHLDLTLALIESHGLAGQTLRGETPRALLAPFVAYLRSEALALAADLGVDRSRAVDLACDALHVINVCDTAAVRDGLVDDDLLAELNAVRDTLADHGAGGPLDLAAIEDELAVAEDGTWRGDPAAAARSRLAERLCRLRQGRQRAGEPRADVEAAVAGLGDAEAVALATALRQCQLWYCEAATGELPPAIQIAVLAAVAGAARASARGDAGLDRPWHALLQPLVARLHGTGAEQRYRRRLIEAALAGRAIGELLGGAAVGPLGTLVSEVGGGAAIVVDYRDSDEAAALVRLLAIYETKSSARFHALLKVLCDLYGLRKDEFDRVANEAAYLATMNAARSDKDRMLDFVRPGRIVEVGPGGGVVLDLLEARFPDADIMGLDASAEVVAALQSRRGRERRRWRIVHGDAFALPALVGPGTVDTVVFCSVLHEIYSYVERAGDDGSPPRRFRLESVRDLLREAWAALAPGGRIVIRDGVAPPPGVRRLRLVAPDARELLPLFAAEFEGRRVTWRDLPDGRVELGAWDAMEFLYTYTWGPESFPYEVREQYGVLPYDEYVAHLVAWLGGPTVARALPLPPAMRSYLQPGYRDGLAGKIEITDDEDRPVALPDSNCLIVIEKV